MIRLENITYSATDESGKKNIILDSLSLDIESGKYVVITGPNGGGKTSLARIIMGIYTPDSGKVYLDSEDITEKSVSERAAMGLGFGFQHPPRFKGMTVRDLLSIAAKRKLRHSEMCDYLTEVGLCAADYLNREVDTSLSGGELKRIEIASVLATGSPIMIFDEPEAGIDLWSFHRLTETFKSFHERSAGENGTSTLIIISHQERIISQADEVILIADGKVSGRGKPNDILPEIDSFAARSCPRQALS
ncbi:MAG: ATP-binding cassette domain-containing protein [Clostridiales bacterium]|nr:ATP-binding cassette domain-containing protein [Clostridiales bacterium]